LQTLKQMPETGASRYFFPSAEIADQPAIKYRGVMMDFAHGALLKAEEIKRQKGAVDLLPNTNIMAGPSYISVLSLFYILC